MRRQTNSKILDYQKEGGGGNFQNHENPFPRVGGGGGGQGDEVYTYTCTEFLLFITRFSYQFFFT